MRRTPPRKMGLLAGLLLVTGCSAATDDPEPACTPAHAVVVRLQGSAGGELCDARVIATTEDRLWTFEMSDCKAQATIDIDGDVTVLASVADHRDEQAVVSLATTCGEPSDRLVTLVMRPLTLCTGTVGSGQDRVGTGCVPGQSECNDGGDIIPCACGPTTQCSADAVCQRGPDCRCRCDRTGAAPTDGCTDPTCQSP